MSDLPFNNTRLTLIDLCDAEFVLSLRTNTELNKHLSKVENDINKQRAWISNYKKKECEDEEYYFILKNGLTPIGTIRMYDFTHDSFCWGSWVVLPNAPIKTALESMMNMYYLAFDILKFKIARIDVRNENAKVLSIHKKIGCKIISIDEQDTYLELSIAEYDACKEKFNRLLK